MEGWLLTETGWIGLGIRLGWRVGCLQCSTVNPASQVVSPESRYAESCTEVPFIISFVSLLSLKEGAWRSVEWTKKKSAEME